VQALREAGHPLIFVAAGERGPTIVADNRRGMLAAMGTNALPSLPAVWKISKATAASDWAPIMTP
jgi:hypothetical protein